MGLFGSIFTLIIAVALPVGAGIWLAARKKGYLRPVLLGVLTFTVFQVLTRIPALQILGTTAWYTMFSMTQPVLYALFLGATAALFEEGGRFLVMRLLMKNRQRVTDGIAFGVGHGGIEAVLLVGTSVLALLITGGAFRGA